MGNAARRAWGRLYGRHLVASRGLYSHHGICVGPHRIIQYHGGPLSRGPVGLSTFAQFEGADPVLIRVYEREFSHRNRVVARARAGCGEDRYGLRSNNCEHFATWCATGERWSRQTDWLRDAGDYPHRDVPITDYLGSLYPAFHAATH